MRTGVVGPGHRRNPRVWPAAGRRGGGCLRHRRAKIRWKTLGRQVEDGLRPDSHTRAVSGVRCPMERRVCPRLMQRWAGKQTVVHQSLRGQTIHNRFCVHFDFRSTEFFLQVSGGVVTHRPLRQLVVPPVRWRVGGGWGRPRRGGQTRCARPPRGAPPSTPTRPTPLASAPARTGTCGPADAAVDAAARHAGPVPRHAGPVPRHARPVSRHQPRRAIRQRSRPTRRPAHRHPWKRGRASGARRREGPALEGQRRGGGGTAVVRTPATTTTTP